MSDEKYPEDKRIGDHAMAVVRSALGAVPVAGAAATELLAYVVNPPLQRRQQEWLDTLAERVKKLEAKGVDLDQLRDDPLFIDAVLAATQAAQRTSSDIKLEALRNSVTNSALAGAPDRARQQIFHGFTERFSDLHLTLLKFAQDASKFARPDGSPLPQRSQAGEVLLDLFPDALREPVYRAVWSDLYNAGLVKLPHIDNGLEGDTRSVRRTTVLGDQYLAFIAEPKFTEGPSSR